jgi:hypothetical protein
MKTNPVDEAIASGKRPDFTKYDKRTIMSSDYFKSIVAKAEKEQDAKDLADPAFQERLLEDRKVEAAVVRDLHDAGYGAITSLEDIKNTPEAYPRAVKILSQQLTLIGDPALTWGISLYIQNLKPTDTKPLVDAIASLAAGPNPIKHLQAVFVLANTIKYSKDKEAIAEAARLLKAVDAPAIRTLLKKLEAGSAK